MNTPNKTSLPCPTCKKTVLWSDEFPYRPFCSKRCQLMDFGDWAEEKHRIPEKIAQSMPGDDFPPPDPGDYQ